MWKTIAAVGTTAVVIGGAGTAAFAATGTPAPAPSAAAASATPGGSATPPTTATGTTKQTRKHPGRDRLRRAVHATWVTEGRKTATFTTHDAIRGKVTAVAPTSITVRAADDLSETFVVNASTKVWTRAPKTAATGAAPLSPAAARTAASISDVSPGDSVFVGGTGTTTLTAVRVVDVKK